MNTYQKAKQRAIDKAAEWQMNFENNNYSYSELITWQNYFEKLAKRFGLVREFRENGII